jgi:hypothetical protein
MQARLSNPLAVFATVLAALAAAAGLIVTGLYRDAPFWVQQARGTDLATLFVAVPVLAVGLVATRRGSAAGAIAVLAGLLYLVYNYAIFSFSVAMNPLTTVHIAIFGLSLWSLLIGGQAAAEAGASATWGLRRRASAALLIGVAALFGLLWLSEIAAAATTGTLAPDLVRAGISTNPVYALDLAFFLPLCAVAGIGLLRRDQAAAFALPMLIWVPLMGAGILGGFVLAARAGDEVPIVVAAVIGLLCVGSATLAVAAVVRPTPDKTFGPRRQGAEWLPDGSAWPLP